MDPLHSMLLVVGLLALVGSWAQLLIISAREDFTWGLCSLLLPPLSYLYGFFRWQLAKEPLLLAIAGWFFIALSQSG